MARWRTRHRGLPRDRGAAAVEFAIVLIVLLLIIFAIIDFGRLFFAVQGVKSASREGARAAVISGAVESSVATKINDAVAGAQALAGGGAVTKQWGLTDPPGATITDAGTATTPCDGGPDGSPLTVRVSIPFTWFTPTGLFASSVNSVEASTTMRCE